MFSEFWDQKSCKNVRWISSSTELQKCSVLPEFSKEGQVISLVTKAMVAPRPDFTGVLWERDLYILVPAPCEGRFVHSGTGFLWDRVLYIFGPVSCERRDFYSLYRFLWERVLYIFLPASGRGEVFFILHTCTSLRWGRDLYVFVLASCEIEICAYLYQLPVRERYVHIGTGLLWKRDVYICIN